MGVSYVKNFNILIVDDQKDICRFLQLELEHEGYHVFIANNGYDAIELVKSNSIDLILLDVMMNGIDGIETCKRIRTFSSVPIIMLTAKSQLSDKIAGLDEGADDYITKPFEIEELLARIRVYERKANDKFETLFIGELKMNVDKRRVECLGKEIKFTKTEFDLLKFLLKNKEIVMDRQNILNKVWGYDYFGDENIVDVYIRHLREKLEQYGLDKKIQTVRGVGYVIKNED